METETHNKRQILRRIKKNASENVEKQNWKRTHAYNFAVLASGTRYNLSYLPHLQPEPVLDWRTWYFWIQNL